MWQLLFAILWLIPTMSFCATIYIDSTLAANCTTGNYSVTNRNCAGSNGNAYRTIAAALNASAANDTLRLRQGSYATPTGGIFPKAGQTWESCRTSPCGSTETATITGSGQARIIYFDSGADGGANVTFRNLTLSGSTLSAVDINRVQGLVLDGLNISGYNSSNTDYEHGISLSYWGTPMQNFQVKNCIIHDAGSANIESAGIGIGGPSSNGLIENNLVYNSGNGIRLDVSAGAVGEGFIPHTVQGNTVRDITDVCYHVEARSSWILQRNIASNCGREGIRVRPGNPGTAGMLGHRYFNNTIYNVGPNGGTNALWVPHETPLEVFDDAQFKNNIFINKSSNPTINIGKNYHTDANVIFQNNIIRNLGAGSAVCWGDAEGFSQSCDSPGTSYANTESGVDSWDTGASNVSNSNTSANADPLFADAANDDFRPCTASGQPAAGCTTASPAINQGVDVGLPYNGAAPDLGALESGGSGTTELLPPQDLRIVTP